MGDESASSSQATAGQVPDDDLTIPRAAMNKYIRELCPDLRVGCETRELLLQVCTEFIHAMSTEANVVCNNYQKKTITPDHILKALINLGFDDYVEEAESVLKDCKAMAAKKRRKSSRLENLGIPEEDLLKQQQELFAKAREEQSIVDQKKWIELQQQVIEAEQRAQPLQLPADEYDDDDEEGYDEL